MSQKRIPVNYKEMNLLEAKRFDRKVRENFMPAIISMVAEGWEFVSVLPSKRILIKKNERFV